MAVETLPCYEATDGFFAAGKYEDRVGEQDRSKNRSIKELTVLYYCCINPQGFEIVIYNFKQLQLSSKDIYDETITEKREVVNKVISRDTQVSVIPALILSFRH